MQETEPASVAAPRAWQQLPGRAESSPNSPGEDRPQDKTKANTRRTLGGTMALQRRGCFQHSAEKELLALKNPRRLKSGDKAGGKNWQERLSKNFADGEVQGAYISDQRNSNQNHNTVSHPPDWQ